MSHTCHNILFHCMDFRLTREIGRWLEEEKMMGDCDIVALAGSAKEIVDGDEASRNLLLKQIEISASLHHASRVILMHHTQCGAYAQSYEFASTEEELNKHREDLTKAENIIKSKFPDIEVLKIIAVMKDGDGKEIIFKQQND